MPVLFKLKMTFIVVPARRKDTLAGGEARIETRGLNLNVRVLLVESLASIRVSSPVIV